MAPPRVLVLHGPNLNLLGEREPEVYGRLTLAELNGLIRAHARRRRAAVRIFQSNHEGELIDCIHANRRWADGLVLNPGALTHYSYALRDAISASRLDTVETHFSDIMKREPFRRRSVIAEVCVGRVLGRGARSYLDALDLILARAR